MGFLIFLPLSIPLLNPSSALLTPFPHRTPAPPGTPSVSPPFAGAITPLPRVPVPSAPPASSPIMPATVPVKVPIPPVKVMGTGTPAATPAPPVPAVPSEEFPAEVPPNHLDVHKVTITPTVAIVLLELAAGSLAEVGDRGEVGDDGAAGVEATVQSLESGGSVVLLLELDVDVTDHVVGEVVTDVEALDLAELGELLENVLVEVLEMLLNLAGVDGVALGVDSGGDHVGALVHVGEDKGRGDGGAVMEAGASVAVAASADLEVEWAVNPILLGAENRS